MRHFIRALGAIALVSVLTGCAVYPAPYYGYAGYPAYYGGYYAPYVYGPAVIVGGYGRR